MTNYLPALSASESFEGQIDRMLNDAVRAFGIGESRWTPPCNVWEDQHGFYVQMALPGWEPKDVSLEVEKQVLTVKGERNIGQLPDRKVYLWEIAADRFVRMFRLPSFVDQDRASASHKNGMLTISFPKREEAKPRRIAIEG
ncbi:MAG TPA: Hsp20/alpha crystallin family protein [Nitrospira sp.]|nr:Hsp20/alpha crystallin family protein [Nitrospira sp.]